MNGKAFLLLAITLSILLAAGIITGIGVTAGPTISPLDANSPTRSNNLTCSWTPSSDLTDQNASWYNGSTLYSTNTTPNGNYIRLPANIARKGQTWRCNVSLANATRRTWSATSVTIKNALPSLANATNEMLYEDRHFATVIRSTDADGDALLYYKLGTKPTYCTLAESTGLLSCDPAMANIGTVNATFIVDDGGSYYAKTNVTYTVVAVNDPPQFTLTNQVATEGTLFRYYITATDEEGNTPINFTIQSNSSAITIKKVSDTQAYVTFNYLNEIPRIGDRGKWWVRVNATDSGPHSNTPYDNPTRIRYFNLTVLSTNNRPNITTDLAAAGIGGTQGSRLVFGVNATDIDGDNLTFGIVSSCGMANPWNITTTDSSANATGLVNLTLTNDHVVCDVVNITVTDGDKTDWELVALNLTNTNDPPVLHQESFYDQNTLDNTNMSNLTAVQGQLFWFRVNVTDPDQLTYEGEIFSFTDNGTGSIRLNATTGVMSFAINMSHVGTHHLLVNVSDDQGLWSARELYLTVINNTPPLLNPFDNLSCAEDFPCSINITAFDPDPLDNLTFTSNDTTVFPLRYLNRTAWLVDYTPTNALVGSYRINISVTDMYGFSDRRVIDFTVNNTNDVPYFDGDRDHDADNVTFGLIVAGYPFAVTVNVTDEDLDIGLDTLSYNWSFIKDDHGLAAGFGITHAGDDHFTVGFTPSVAQADNYTVNLSVTDLAGATQWQLVNFTVLQQSITPIVRQVRPYWNATLNRTVLAGFRSTVGLSGTVGANVSENQTVVFDANVTADMLIAGNRITAYRWYIAGTLNRTIVNPTPGTGSSLSTYFGFFDAGQTTVMLQAEDTRYATVNWTWLVNISDFNRPPRLVHSMLNLSVNGTVQYLDVMSHYSNASGWQQVFYDPDDDLDSNGRRSTGLGEPTNLTYSIVTGYNCTLAEIEFSGDDLTISPTDEGVCIVRFQATDPGNRSVESNLVRITIVSAAQEIEVPSNSGGGQSQPRMVPYPFEIPIKTPHPIEIITPGRVLTFANQTIKIPFTIKNTWNETIRDITLNATMGNGTGDPQFKMSQPYFPQLLKGEEREVILTIQGYKSDGPLTVVVYANVGDPKFKDAATITISALEERSQGDNVESKVTFARDLLNENPECQELNELLAQAEEARLRGDGAEASRLIAAAMNGCKYLINQQKAAESEQPKDFFAVLTITPKQLPEIAVGALIVLVLFGFGIMMIVSGRKGGKTDI